MDSTGYQGKERNQKRRVSKKNLRKNEDELSAYSKPYQQRISKNRARSAYLSGKGAVTSTNYLKNGSRGQKRNGPQALPQTMMNIKQNIMKTKARHIYHEPEALREEIFVLQRKHKKLRKINEKLKNKHEKIEQENEQYEQFIQENEALWLEGSNQESTLLVSLRKQERKLEDTLRGKEQDYENALKSVKSTKINEMEIESKELEEECKRLNMIFLELMQTQDGESDMSQLEQKYYKQKNLINFLKRDNHEMSTRLKILVLQNENYKDELVKYETNIGECDTVLGELKVKVRTKDLQIKALRREANESQMSKNEHKVLEELEEVKETKFHLTKALEHKQKQVVEMEQELDDLQKEFDQQMLQDNQEKESLKRELNKLTNLKSNESLNSVNDSEKRSNLDTSEEKDDSLRRQDSEDSVTNIGLAHQNLTEEDEEGNEEEEEKRVELDPIIVQELVYKLRKVGKTSDQVGDLLFDESELEEGYCSINNLRGILENEPLSLYNEDQKEHFIRELLWLIGSKEDKQPIKKVLSAFKQILGDYEVLNENEHQRKVRLISKNDVIPILDQLKENLEKSPKSKMNQAEIKEIFIWSNHALSAESLDYITFRLYLESHNMSRLEFSKIFEIFKGNDEENPIDHIDDFINDF